jgi:hypothetical protein
MAFEAAWDSESKNEDVATMAIDDEETGRQASWLDGFGTKDKDLEINQRRSAISEDGLYFFSDSSILFLKIFVSYYDVITKFATRILDMDMVDENSRNGIYR